MRLLYLSPKGQLGGAETSLRELLAAIRANGPDCEPWLIVGEDGPLVAEAKDRDVQVVVAPFPPALARLGDTGGLRLAVLGNILIAAFTTIRYLRRLKRIVNRIRPDIVHTNGFKMHIVGALTCPRGTSLIWHMHDYISNRKLMRPLLRLFANKCSLAIANSKSVAGDIRTCLPDLKSLTIYNAVDLKWFSPAGNHLDLDALTGLSPAADGVIRVGLIATFARWKGHKVFLQAVSGMRGESPVRAYIIGGPIYQTDGSQWSFAELQQEVDRLGLTGKVGFTGFLADIPAAIRSLDVVVHASTEAEPFGMVIVEAMACQKAVIVSQSGGASELFEDDENALAHPSGDVGVLARQISRLADDRNLRERLGKAGRATAERLYDRQRLGIELLSAYREIRRHQCAPYTQPAGHSPFEGGA